jgi:hypothetical protein
MPITIDEVTADVSEPAARGSSEQQQTEQPSAATEQRRFREQLDRLQQRTARVRAN